MRERKYYRYEKKEKSWTDESVRIAVNTVKTTKRSIREVAKEFHMSNSKLRKAILEDKGEATSTWQGRRRALTDADETRLADIIIASARANFGFGTNDLPKLFKDYAEIHELGIWIEDDQYPSQKFCIEFCHRHRISSKLPQRMSLTRILATSDPFVIYSFYDLVEAEVAKLPEENRAAHIINCDESNTHHDAARRGVLGAVGEYFTDARVAGGYANTTFLAACRADGQAFPPLVVFRGQNKPADKVLDGCLPGMTVQVSENGWMTADIFATWFKQLVAELNLNPNFFKQLYISSENL